MDYMIRFEDLNMSDPFFKNPENVSTSDLIKVFKSVSSIGNL